MKHWKRPLVVLLSLLMLAAAFSACSGAGNTTPDAAPAAETDESGDTTGSQETQDLVVMVTPTALEIYKEVEEMLLDHFDGVYNVIAKPWEETSVEQTVKTAVAGGTQIDLVQWNIHLSAFTSAGVVEDLTPYMDDEWAATFNEGALELGTYDGKLMNIPFNNVYPMVIANMDIADEAGIVVKEQYTWDEFVEACRQVTENTDAYGACINQDWACWLVRNGLMQAWDTDEELDLWNSGQVSFYEQPILDMMEKIALPFNDNLFYPGDGSLAVTLDQANAAFGQNKFAFMFCVNTIATETIGKAGVENYQILDWPAMGNNPRNALLGGCDGYFVPTSTKNIEGAVEAIRFLTSREVMTKRAEAGMIPTTAIDDSADVDEDLIEAISRCVGQIYPTEVQDIDAELEGYIMYQMPANYIYNGSTAIDDMEALRLAAME